MFCLDPPSELEQGISNSSFLTLWSVCLLPAMPITDTVDMLRTWEHWKKQNIIIVSVWLANNADFIYRFVCFRLHSVHAHVLLLPWTFRWWRVICLLLSRHSGMCWFSCFCNCSRMRWQTVHTWALRALTVNVKPSPMKTLGPSYPLRCMRMWRRTVVLKPRYTTPRTVETGQYHFFTGITHNANFE